MSEDRILKACPSVQYAFLAHCAFNDQLQVPVFPLWAALPGEPVNKLPLCVLSRAGLLFSQHSLFLQLLPETPKEV